MSDRTLRSNGYAEDAAWILAGILVFWSFGYTIMRGSDLWWHIAGGRWMVEHGTLWVREPFGYTAEGRWWLNDAWLSDVLLYLWTRAFGVESLAYWKWLLIIATWLLAFRLFVRIGDERITAFAVATFGLAVAEPFLDVRPQLYSFLGFVILLSACWQRRPPSWLPVLFVVWVNLHAGFLIGLIVLPILFLGSLYEDRSQWRRLGLLGAACVIACLVNPHGAEVVFRPLRYAFDSTSPFRQLGEWKPPFEPGGIQSWLFPYSIGVFVAASVAAVVDRIWIRKSRRIDVWVGIIVGALTLAMSLRSRRFIPFYGIAMGPVVAYVLARAGRSLLARLPAFLGPAVAAALGIYWLQPYPQASYAFDYLTARYEFPVDTARFIRTNHLTGKVFNYYNWGGYVEMTTFGDFRVFIDGRAGTVYDDQTFVDYLKVLHERPGWKEVVENSGAEWFLWPFNAGNVARELLEDGSWAPVYRDHKSVLLRRSGLPPLTGLRPTEDSAYKRLSAGFLALVEGRFADAETDYQRALDFEPYLAPACVGLARAQALSGKDDVAKKTIVRCDEMFPGQGRTEWFDTFLEMVRERRGAS